MAPVDSEENDPALGAALERVHSGLARLDRSLRDEITRAENRVASSVTTLRADLAEWEREHLNVRDRLTKLETRQEMRGNQLDEVRGDVRAGQRDERSLYREAGETGARVTLVVAVGIAIGAALFGAVMATVMRGLVP